MNRPIWTAILITANVIFNVARTEEDSCSGETTQQGINICTAKAAKAAEAALAAAGVGRESAAHPAIQLNTLSQTWSPAINLSGLSADTFQ